MERLTDNKGFTYHQFIYRDIGKGQSHAFTISYTKTVPTPSVPKPQPTPQRSEKEHPRVDHTLVSLGILAGAILLFAGLACLVRGPQRRPRPDAVSSSESVPLADALLALLQEDAQTQMTANTSPTPQQIRVINFCAHCGRKLLPDDRFCSGCGKPIKR